MINHSCKVFLNRTSEVFQHNYVVLHDRGDLLRAVVLVVSLQKLNDEKFYKNIFSIILKNISSISFPNLLTILESYSFNKWLFKVASFQQVTDLLRGASAKLQLSDIGSFSKYASLLSYLAKAISVTKKNSQGLDIVENQLLADVNKLYDLTLQFIVNDRNKSLDIFTMTDILLSLESFSSVYPKLKVKEVLLKKYYDSMIESYLPKKSDFNHVKYNLNYAISFLKRFYIAPPAAINPQFGALINHVFLKNAMEPNFRKLENYMYFLLFLVKTDSLDIPETYKKQLNMEALILQERNLFFLSKTLEFFSFCEQANKNYFSPEKTELAKLEKVIFQIISRLPPKTQASPSLLQIFQLMVALNKGSNSDWKTLLSIFGSKESLDRLDHMDLIIKLVPAGAVKTKNIFKLYSNIPMSSSTHNLDEPQVDPQLKKLLETFWENIEAKLVERVNDIYPDKFPIILLNFIYANMFKESYKKVYPLLRQRIADNLSVYTPKQLSEIVYSYSRMQERSNDVMFGIAKKVLDEKLYEKFDEKELTNFYWAYANANVWVEELSTVCESRLFNQLHTMSLESFTPFCQALAINNKKLDASEIESLNAYTLKLIRTLAQGKKSFSIQNILAICNSFNVMKNFSDLKVWEELIKFLVDRRDSFENSGLFLYYVYSLYIHMTIENIDVAGKEDLFKVVQDNYRRVLEYIKLNKKNFVSRFEEKVRKIVEDNLHEVFGEQARIAQDDEVITLFRGRDHDLLMAVDLKNLDELIQKKKLPKLGVRELLFPHTVDIVVDKHAIEVNGPWHYLQDQKGNIKESGYNALKRITLQKSGLKYIEVPYTIHKEDELENNNQILQYIKDRVHESQRDSL